MNEKVRINSFINGFGHAQFTGYKLAVRTGRLKGRRGRRRSRKAILNGLETWNEEISVSEIVGRTRDRRRLWSE